MSFLASLNGYKTYIAAGLGIVIILVSHFLGVQIPGVSINDSNWMADIWALILVMTGRSAIDKLAP